MKVVIDTNCFISCIGKRSRYRNVFDAFLAGQYTLCLTAEVLFEYEEIFQSKWEKEVAENLLTRMIRAKNVEFINISFRFNLIYHDADDNKFADLYVASNADFLVSDDTKLLAMNNSDFPVFNVTTLEEFSLILNKPTLIH